jgi:hypothetical protein
MTLGDMHPNGVRSLDVSYWLRRASAPGAGGEFFLHWVNE